MNTPQKKVAAIVTEYRVRSHADNIVTRLLEGYDLQGVPVRPRVEVAALYTDQVPANDISRELAAQHAVPIFPTIRETLTLGGDTLAVDGVVIVGEHGDYPWNEKGQHLYPRRRFFEETVAVFRQSGRVVPVFNDKHLAWNWADARWIYDTAQAMGIPLMAGSSMPFTPRCPPLHLPLGVEVEEIVVVAHGGLESYGFHALEIAQCLAERRRGGETGVASVQCLTGGAFWEALRAGSQWSRDLEAAALAEGAHGPGTPFEHYGARFARGEGGQESRGGQEAYGAQPGLGTRPTGERRESNEPAIFLVEYRDGLRLSVLMLNGYVTRRAAAVRVRGVPPSVDGAGGRTAGAPREVDTLAAWFMQPRGQPLWHFCHLVDHIERMVETGTPPNPIERTLLTTGLVDAALTSRHEGGRRLDTPYLDIAYRPPDEPAHHVRSATVRPVGRP